MPDAAHAITLSANADPVLVVLGQIGDPADLPEALRERLFDLCKDPAQLCTVNRDVGAATRAGELRYVFEPSPALLEIATAARAWNLENVAIEIEGHDGSCPEGQAVVGTASLTGQASVIKTREES